MTRLTRRFCEVNGCEFLLFSGIFNFDSVRINQRIVYLNIFSTTQSFGSKLSRILGTPKAENIMIPTIITDHVISLASSKFGAVSRFQSAAVRFLRCVCVDPHTHTGKFASFV